MTYLAPRQGLFAIVLLVSFLLQTLLLVISTDQQLSKNREQKGEQTISQLIAEAHLSLENKDRVSLSVIANRYTSEQDIARLVIKEGKGDVLVSVGNAPMQKGTTISQIATEGEAVIGSVTLTLKDTSMGEIIAMQWPFVIGSLFFHLLLWFAYGHIARPTKAQIEALSREIENHRHNRASTSADSEHDTISKGRLNRSKKHPSQNDTTHDSNSHQSVHDGVNDYIKSQQSHSESGTVNGHKTTSASVATDRIQRQLDNDHKELPSVSKLSATREFDSVNVQIMFQDEYRMLERLTPEMRDPYLALCSELLNQATIELLKQPLLSGISVTNQPFFDDSGASVILKADNSQAKVALAGVMLAKLYLMLNKIIHDKHVELRRFALPVKAGVSDQASAMKLLLKTVGRKEQMLILVPNAGLKQIGNHIQVQSVKRPTTVYERECAIFDGGNAAMMERLGAVRDEVLTNGSRD